MTAPVDPSWVLALMLKAQPSAPWQSTYPTTAAAIAKAASASPLFAGPLGAEQTAAEMVSVAWFESRFDPAAEGDHDCLARDADGKCTKKGKPRSFCAMQISETNFAGLGVTKAEVQGSIEKCVETGLRLMHVSYRTCARQPHEKRLAHYAGGGYSCPGNEDANRKSEHRVAKALWLFRNVPPDKREVLVER